MVENKTINVLSYGGGVQSVATILLIVQKKIIKPDIIVMSDTGREKQSTFNYLEKYIKPLIEVEVIKAADWLTENDYSIFTRYSTGQTDTKLPVFLDNGGKMKPRCSDRWKRVVINHYLREHLKIKNCKLWLGFTRDEAHRVKRRESPKWCQYSYPLMDRFFKHGISPLFLSRADCLRIIQSFGLPIPPKSSCYMCPHMKLEEWRSLPVHELQKAADIEQEIQQKLDLDNIPYLTRTCIPLKEAVKKDIGASSQVSLLGWGCDSGFCFV